MSDYYIKDGELYHYGVVGMKWGVIRSAYLNKRNNKLRKKALDYDNKSAKIYKKAEKAHSEYDLDRSNRSATKAAKYQIKAAKLSKKALKTDSDIASSYLTKKAETAKYKAAKYEIKANRLSKSTGYGAKAMQLSVKSDRLATKAAKVRKMIASNEYYINRINQKVSTIKKDQLASAYAFVDKYVNP